MSKNGELPWSRSASNVPQESPFFCCVTETSCPDIHMGFCIETTGLTQGGQGEACADLDMAGACLEEPGLKDEAESMEDEQDPEVWNGTLLTVF